MTDSNDAPGHLWAIHSSSDDRPVVRDWARSREEAEQKQEALRTSDGIPEDEYWITQLTEDQIQEFKANGFIPEDA